MATTTLSSSEVLRNDDRSRPHRSELTVAILAPLCPPLLQTPLEDARPAPPLVPEEGGRVGEDGGLSSPASGDSSMRTKARTRLAALSRREPRGTPSVRRETPSSQRGLLLLPLTSSQALISSKLPGRVMPPLLSSVGVSWLPGAESQELERRSAGEGWGMHWACSCRSVAAGDTRSRRVPCSGHAPSVPRVQHSTRTCRGGRRCKAR